VPDHRSGAGADARLRVLPRVGRVQHAVLSAESGVFHTPYRNWVVLASGRCSYPMDRPIKTLVGWALPTGFPGNWWAVPTLQELGGDRGAQVEVAVFRESVFDVRRFSQPLNTDGSRESWTDAPCRSTSEASETTLEGPGGRGGAP